MTFNDELKAIISCFTSQFDVDQEEMRKEIDVLVSRYFPENQLRLKRVWPPFRN